MGDLLLQKKVGCKCTWIGQKPKSLGKCIESGDFFAQRKFGKSNPSLWQHGSAKEANPSFPDLFATTSHEYEEDAVPECVIVLRHEAGGSILVPSSVF